MVDYSRDIYDILQKAPGGLSIRKIVRHVYNAHNSLFETVDLEDVKRDVTQYLTSRAKSSHSPFEHGEARGVYRLNPSYAQSLQTMLQFSENEETDAEEQDTPPSVDLSLDMFAGMYDQ